MLASDFLFDHGVVFGQSVCDSYDISGVQIYCEILPSTFIVVARSLSSISYEQKKILLVFRIYEYHTYRVSQETWTFF